MISDGGQRDSTLCLARPTQWLACEQLSPCPLVGPATQAWVDLSVRLAGPCLGWSAMR